MKLVALITFISLVGVGSSTLLGSNKCTWGPSYWCSRVSRARECGAVNHCLQTVWTKQEVTATQDSNTQCDLCEKLINMARKMLNTKPVNEVMAYIRDLCEVLPFKQTYNTECLTIVDDVDTTIKVLQSDMSAKSICGVYMSCSGFDDQVNHHHQPETNVIVQLPLVKETPIKASNICTDCVAFMTDLRNLLTDPSTERRVISIVKEIVCYQLDSLEVMCDDLVDTYVPQGLSYLASYVEPQLTCYIAGFCGGQNTPDLRNKLTLIKNIAKVAFTKVDVPPTGVSVECSMCEELVQEVRTFLLDTTIQKMIVDFIETNFCDNLGDLADVCKRAIDNNADGVFQLITDSLVNNQVCINMGLCTHQVVAPVQTGSVEFGASKAVVDALASLEKSTFVHKTIRSLIENNVCTKHGLTEAECKKHVELYATAVFKILKQILTANRLCTAAPVSKVMSSGALCEVCELVVKEMAGVLTQKSTLAEIEMFLDNICQRLRGNLNVKCKKLVDEYTPCVLSMLAEELDPTTVCKTLGLCPANQSIKPSPPKAVGKTIKANGTCVLCEFLVRELAYLLKENRTKTEVRQELVNLCGEFSAIKDECKTFLNLFFDVVYDMLMKKVDPKTVCTTIELCSAKVAHKPALPLVSNKVHIVPLMQSPSPIKTFNVNTPRSSGLCTICEDVLINVGESLTRPVTEDTMKSLLNTACGMMPQYLQQTCEGFVQQYTPQLVQWLEHEDDPFVICRELGVCDKTQETVKAQKPKTDTNLYFRKQIFTKKCDRGPSYWCLSRRIAIKCGKEYYCYKRNLTNKLMP